LLRDFRPFDRLAMCVATTWAPPSPHIARFCVKCRNTKLWATRPGWLNAIVSCTLCVTLCCSTFCLLS
jgi:hypothetical protein